MRSTSVIKEACQRIFSQDEEPGVSPGLEAHASFMDSSHDKTRYLIFFESDHVLYSEPFVFTLRPLQTFDLSLFEV